MANFVPNEPGGTSGTEETACPPGSGELRRRLPSRAPRRLVLRRVVRPIRRGGQACPARRLCDEERGGGLPRGAASGGLAAARARPARTAAHRRRGGGQAV